MCLHVFSLDVLVLVHEKENSAMSSISEIRCLKRIARGKSGFLACTSTSTSTINGYEDRDNRGSDGFESGFVD